MRRPSGLRGVIAGVVGTSILLGLIGLTVVYTGAYNVAATAGHTPFARWALSTTYRNSVEGYAEDIVQPRFTPAMVRKGAAEYKEYCQHCHGGPGARRAEWATGMLPMPPYLTKAATEWRPREIFWILKHGVKMSGMPSFGHTESDDTLWALTAFVEQMPKMSAAEYQAIGGSGHHHGGRGH